MSGSGASVLSLLRSLRRHRNLVLDFVARDLKARYVGSSMGFFWSVVFPILNLCVYLFVFRFVLRVRWGDGEVESQTALNMLAGILVWSAFAETISRSTNCLVEHANLIQKVVFPAEILPPFLALSALANMAIGLPVVLMGVVFLSLDEGLALAFHPERLGLSLCLLPALVLLQGVFTVGLGYLLCTLNVYVRDTYHVVAVLVTVWMFATPIFYPAFLVSDHGFGWILGANPMHWLIDSYRRILIAHAWPDWRLALRFALVALVFFALGARFFGAHRLVFPDLL